MKRTLERFAAAIAWICITTAAPAETKEPQPDLARPSRTAGFEDGVFLVSYMRGMTIAVGGSFIQHERDYDDNLKARIATGGIQQEMVPGQPTVYYRSDYLPRDISQFDFEYAFADRFGLGFSIVQYAVDTYRQDVVPGFSYSREFIDPLPQQRNLFQGTAGMGLFTFHPLPARRFDPYVAVRGGAVGFTGEAHQNLTHDRYRYTNRIRSGIGFAMGAGVGVNVFVLRKYAAIKFEASYNKMFLKSDMFANRTLNSYHAQAGIVVNYASLEDAAGSW